MNGNIDIPRLPDVGVDGWNAWRRRNRLVRPNLNRINLSGIDLSGINLRFAQLFEANLEVAILRNADLRSASLQRANLAGCVLRGARFENAVIRHADMRGSDLRGADLKFALLSRANLSAANLEGTDMRGASLRRAKCVDTKFANATLRHVSMVECNVDGADFHDSQIYGVSAWSVKGTPGNQSDLVIQPYPEQPELRVDNLEVAQFIYLLRENEKIRDVLNTITTKAVLILGRFTPERKPVLEAVRQELRNRGFVPIIFDFERARDRDFTETVATLAGMSRFVVADITNPASAPLELQATVPDYMVPFVPILQSDEKPFSMFVNLQQKYNWVLDVLEYRSEKDLIQVFDKAILVRAHEKYEALAILKAQDIRRTSTRDFM